MAGAIRAQDSTASDQRHSVTIALSPAASTIALSLPRRWVKMAYSRIAHAERRRRTRTPAEGTIRFLWTDEAGQERISVGELVDVSPSGLRLKVLERIPARTYILCNESRLGISGRGAVRHCNFSKGKYVLGIEFTGIEFTGGPKRS
jgi:hypothetical protein